MRFNYLFLIFLGLLSFNALFADAYKKTDNGIIINTERGKIKIELLADNIFHISAVKGDRFSSRKSLIILDKKFFVDKPSVRQEDDKIAIDGKNIKAVYNIRENIISFYDGKGDLIIHENGREIVPAKVSGEQVYHIKQNFKLSPAEALYGLGQFQDGVMNWRGHDVTLVQENTVAVNPFIVSNKNYGILWDNYSMTKFHDGHDGMSIWSKVADQIDYYLINADNIDGVIAGYRYLTGDTPMFGKWAYGYWQSKERYRTQKEIINIVKEYRKRKLPLDNIVLDWTYWGDDIYWNSLEFNKERFPDPAKMLRDAHKMNVHFMISIWPNFGSKAPVYTEMEKRGFLIGKGENRGLYDAYNKKARDYYWQWLNKNMFSIGMDAWWMDATEPETKGDTPEERGENLEKIGRNSMGSMARYLLPFSLMSTQGVYENQRKTNDKKRVYILTRSGFAGQQRYGAVTWSGDIHAQWSVFRNQISAGINFCMTGIPYWTTDIGAFLPDNPLGNRGESYREIYVRWFQFGAFCPMFRSHGSGTAREIWNFGGEKSWTYKPLVRFDNLRYRLLPYIYSLAWQVTDKRYTIMRGLPFDFNDDCNVYEIDNEYMFGPAFLVRPVTEKMYFNRTYTGMVIPAQNLFDENGKKGALTTRFYNGQKFDTLVVTRRESKLDWNWNDGVSKPKALHQHYYSMRFSGEILAPESGQYTIVTNSNDGIRVWLDGKLVIDNWTDHGVTTNMGEINLKAGKRYKIKMEYYQTLGGAVTKLAWILPSERDKMNAQKIPPVKYIQVYLPKAQGWYDFWRGEKLAGGQTVEVPAPIDEMPLFIKSGSIVPMGPYLQYAMEKPADPMELRIYAGADADFLLYEDEGDSYNYEKGFYSTILFRWNDKKQTLTIGERKGNFPGMLKDRKFNIIFVNKDHGVGVRPEKSPDKIINYNGKKIVICQ